jgi:glycosyltransferase involved in cell wall biosynthesis
MGKPAGSRTGKPLGEPLARQAMSGQAGKLWPGKPSGRLRILEVNTYDQGGGAERVARDLLLGCRQRGHEAWLAVAEKRTDDPGVFVIPNNSPGNPWSALCWWAHDRVQAAARGWQPATLPAPQSGIPPGGTGKPARWLTRLLRVMGQPRNLLDRRRGIEDFHAPGTWRLLSLCPPVRPVRQLADGAQGGPEGPRPPDILHCHNLHSPPGLAYFDLRALPALSREVPVALTLHDAWLLSGHCAHSFDCQRWKIGCGQCPDLTIYPSVPRDATDYNWKRKRDVFSRSRLYITTPSRWLMDKVQESMLHGAKCRVIPNGVDLSVFRPGDRLAARAALGLPLEARIVLLVSTKPRTSPWRDFATMQRAVQWLAGLPVPPSGIPLCGAGSVAGRTAGRPFDPFDKLRAGRLRVYPPLAGHPGGVEGRELLFLCVGGKRRAEQVGGAITLFAPYEADASRLARYYQAADIYMQASKVDTFPGAVLEALACGTPVVATATGGIPEQIEHGRSGFLTPPGDAEEMARRAEQILSDPALRGALSEQAAESARRRFDLKRVVGDYLDWYGEVIEDFQRQPASPGT